MGTQANQLAPQVEAWRLASITTGSGDAEKTSFHPWSEQDQRTVQVGGSGVGPPLTVVGARGADAHQICRGQEGPAEKLGEFDCGNVGTTAVEKPTTKLTGSEVSPLLVSVQVQTDNGAHSSDTPGCLSIFDSRESKMGGTQTTNGSHSLGVGVWRAAASSEKGGRCPADSRRIRRQRPSSPAKSGVDESTTPHGGKKKTDVFWQDPYKYSMPSERVSTEQATLADANPESIGTVRKTDGIALKERMGMTGAKNLKPPRLARSPLSRDQAPNRTPSVQPKDNVSAQRKVARGKKRIIGTDTFGMGARKVYLKSNPKGTSNLEAHHLGEKNTAILAECKMQPAKLQQASRAGSGTVVSPNSKLVGLRPSTWRKAVARNLHQGEF